MRVFFLLNELFSYIVVPLTLESNGMLQYAFNVFHHSISMTHLLSSDYPVILKRDAA